MNRNKILLVYETKCRRCGHITEWSFGNNYEKFNEENWLKLHKWVSAHLLTPSVCSCEKCGGQTIQDYVSYTDKGGGRITNPTKY